MGTALIGGQPIVIAVMDFSFLAGSMGVEVGRRISEAADAALRLSVPMIMVCASGGARMQEGVFSLLQMARTAQAFARLGEAGVLSVCVLTDPTYGGVSASFANLGSVVIAERGAHVGFAGPRVVQETIRTALPKGFQTAEFLLQHGLVDRVESRADLRPLLIRIVGLHTSAVEFAPLPKTDLPETQSPAPPRIQSPDPMSEPGRQRDSWETVQTARQTDRPSTLDYLEEVFDDFVEMHGDRAYSDDPAVVGGIASLGGRSVVVIGHQKGHTLNELVARNFGMPHPEGYRKAIRLLKHAERFDLPVVTFIDTPGAHPGPEAEERGQSIAIADTIGCSVRLRVPIVSVITGEGGSGGALALCTSDRMLVLRNAFLSVISPEGCAAILWRTASSAPSAARALHLGAATSPGQWGGHVGGPRTGRRCRGRPDGGRSRLAHRPDPRPDRARGHPRRRPARGPGAAVLPYRRRICVQRAATATAESRELTMSASDVGSRSNGLHPAHAHPDLPASPAVPSAITGSAEQPSLQQLGLELTQLARTLSGPLRRLSVRSGECEISVEWDAGSPEFAGASGGSPPGPTGVAVSTADTVGILDGASTVRSPLVGTYFAAPAPDAEPFVRPGQVVAAGQTLAIVEAMKMMNAVVAEEPGVVADILVANGDSVEFDQPLIVLTPEVALP